MNSAYSDIKHLTRPPSAKVKMKRQDRAKIFSPFDALSGYSAAIQERNRILIPRPALAADAKEILNQKLRLLEPGMTVTVIFFAPQTSVDGEPVGELFPVSGTVERIDELNRALHLDQLVIPLEDLVELHSDVFESVDNGYV